jgi:hypothetical protein
VVFVRACVNLIKSGSGNFRGRLPVLSPSSWHSLSNENLALGFEIKIVPVVKKETIFKDQFLVSVFSFVKVLRISYVFLLMVELEVNLLFRMLGNEIELLFGKQKPQIGPSPPPRTASAPGTLRRLSQIQISLDSSMDTEENVMSFILKKSFREKEKVFDKIELEGN